MFSPGDGQTRDSSFCRCSPLETGRSEILLQPIYAKRDSSTFIIKYKFYIPYVNFFDLTDDIDNLVNSKLKNNLIGMFLKLHLKYKMPTKLKNVLVFAYIILAILFFNL